MKLCLGEPCPGLHLRGQAGALRGPFQGAVLSAPLFGETVSRRTWQDVVLKSPEDVEEQAVRSV